MRVVKNLRFNNSYDQYEAVFNQQLNDDILESVELNVINKNEHVFSPHRHVLKQDGN